jgi:hypothetical protein
LLGYLSPCGPTGGEGECAHRKQHRNRLIATMDRLSFAMVRL